MSKRKIFSDKDGLQARPGTRVLSALPKKTLAAAAAIALAVFIAYSPSINGGFVLDDESLLTNNPFIRASDGLYRLWCTNQSLDYWPVTNSTFLLEWRLWNMSPAGYHVTNLILHVVEAWLIWIILRKLAVPGAFLAAFVFALHPVNVESVAWIAQRKNMTAMLFFLLSILWYMKAVMPRASVGTPPLGNYPPDNSPPARSHGGPWERETFSSFILHPSSFHFWYWLSLAAFVLAMLGKASAVVLPVVILGITWWLRPLTRRDVMHSAPFFAVAMALAAVNVWFQTHGTELTFRTVGYADRILGAGGVIWFYLYKALWPLNLVFVYPQWHTKAGNPLWWLPLAAALAVTAVLWRYRKGWARPLLFAWGFFCVALAPVLGLKDVGFMEHSLVADHYQHIAIIAVIALASAGYLAWHRRVRVKKREATAVAVAALAVLALLTWRQSGLYSGPIGLYQSTLKENPSSWMAQNNLGIALDNSGQSQAALKYFHEALRLRPNYPEAHYNLGFALVRLNRLREAIEQYDQALSQRPNYAEAHNNLGIVLHKMGRLDEAIDQFNQALRIKSNYPEAQNNLGVALVQAGRPREAIEHYQRAIQLYPAYDKAYFNLGNVYNALGEHQKAVENYLQAVELARSNGHTALAQQVEELLNSLKSP